jgi:hypothetical protein
VLLDLAIFCVGTMTPGAGYDYNLKSLWASGRLLDWFEQGKKSRKMAEMQQTCDFVFLGRQKACRLK